MPGNMSRPDLYRAVYANVINARAQDSVRQGTFNRTAYLNGLVNEYQISLTDAERMWNLASKALYPVSDAVVHQIIMPNKNRYFRAFPAGMALDLPKGEVVGQTLALVNADKTFTFTEIVRRNGLIGQDSRYFQMAFEEALAMVGLFLIGTVPRQMVIHRFNRN